MKIWPPQVLLLSQQNQNLREGIDAVETEMTSFHGVIESKDNSIQKLKRESDRLRREIKRLHVRPNKQRGLLGFHRQFIVKCPVLVCMFGCKPSQNCYTPPNLGRETSEELMSSLWISTSATCRSMYSRSFSQCVKCQPAPDFFASTILQANIRCTSFKQLRREILRSYSAQVFESNKDPTATITDG